jgi:GNAT superfamily N-acetyltransferase
VAAVLLAYVLPVHSDVNLDELPDLLRPLEELELKVPGTFYINVLAAYPEYRGLGLGASFLEEAHMLASEAGCNELSLAKYSSRTRALSGCTSATGKGKSPACRPCRTRPIRTMVMSYC